jgi:hypothetical protein
MKRSDFFILVLFCALFLPFFIFHPAYVFFLSFNVDHAYIASFIKFALLATLGESIGLRIRTGMYTAPGFGFIPRAIVWGFLGISIKMAFVIFGEGAQPLLAGLGVHFPSDQILKESQFSWLKLLTAFTVSTTMNIFFAPVFMTFHKITDLHILQNGGTIRGFLTPISFRRHFQELDWATMWNFVFKKTIPLFWIPAQTLNFMLPGEFRVLVAAIYSIILGVLLSVATMMAQKKISHDPTHRSI